MHGMEPSEAKKNGIRCDAPEINHLYILHPSEHSNELLRPLDPRADDRELPKTGEALERARVLQKVVV